MELDLSIIIPCFNCEKTILKCLASIPMQLNPEVILVDDCSSDNTLQVIYNYIKTNNLTNVKVFRNSSNMGAGQTRNNGISKAGKKYIMFLDADDTLTKQFSTCISEILNKECDLDAVVFDALNATEKENRRLKMFYSSSIKEGYICTKEALVFIRAATWGKIYRRSIICDCAVRFGTIPRNEDLVFTKTAISHCKKILYTAEVLYVYYDNPQSLMNNKALLDERNALIAYREIEKKIDHKVFKQELNSIYFLEVVYASTKTVLIRTADDSKARNYYKKIKNKYNFSDIYFWRYDKKYILLSLLYRLRLFCVVRIMLGVKKNG